MSRFGNNIASQWAHLASIQNPWMHCVIAKEQTLEFKVGGQEKFEHHMHNIANNPQWKKIRSIFEKEL